MLSPYEEHKNLSNVQNIEDLSHFVLFDKYITQNLRGQKKMFDIETSNMEEILMKKTNGLPLPGMIYTFIYKGKPFEIIIEEAKKGEYSDYVPIMLCLGINRDNTIGINLNLLPQNARLNFLQALYEAFRGFYEDADTLAQYGKLAINKRLIQNVNSNKGKELIKYFNDKHGAEYSFGYRKYKLENIINLRMIEFGEYKYIPFYRPKNAFRRMNYDKLHDLYQEKLRSR